MLLYQFSTPWRFTRRLNIACPIYRFITGESAKVGDSKHGSRVALKEAFAELNFIEEELDQLEAGHVRERFAVLVRKYHPDTGGDGELQVSVERFGRLHTAYCKIMRTCFSGCGDEGGVHEEKEEGMPSPYEQDIRHTSPQHRQFLEYGGVGFGTPFERQKFYQQHRASRALETAREFSYERACEQTSNEDSHTTDVAPLRQRSTADKLYRDVKRTQNLNGVIERVVEDLIVSSMHEGLFDNLPGSGKPLPEDYSNPYIDETEKRLNRILKTNGFTPLWIEREAEIRREIDAFRAELRGEMADKAKSSPSSFADKQTRKSLLSKFEPRVTSINRLIRDYNLVAPALERHFMHLCLDRELEKAQQDLVKAEGGEEERVIRAAMKAANA